MSNEEIDDLLKNAAKQYKLPKDDKSPWNDLSARMDAEQRLRSRFRGTVVLLLVLFLSSVTWITVHFTNQNQSDQNSKYNVLENPETTTSLHQLNERTDAKNVNEDKTTDIIENPDQNRVKETVVTADTKIIENNVMGEERSYTPVVIDLLDTEVEVITIPNNNDFLSNTTSIISDSVFADTETVEDAILKDTTNLKESAVEKKVFENGFSIKVSIAPDFSSTEFFQQSKLGFNYGLTAGYAFTNRWSIYTGIIVSKKIYSSTNVEGKYPTNGYVYDVNQIDGSCNVLDLPLNVYYNFNPTGSIPVKIGLGMSSYIMLTEDYTFYVDKPYGTSIYSQNFQNENNEWFKMLNFSVLVEKRLSSSWSVELEPFVKLPLEGIGAGSISLYSFGSFVSLRYDFKRKNKF